MEAALFLLAQPEALPPDVTFVYDSKWTAHMVTGHWRPKRHKAMISLARALYLNLSSKICVHWVWVKGHSGNVGNERADRLAQRGRNSPAAFGGRYSLSRFPLPQDFLSSAACTPTSQDALEQESQLLTSAIVHSALSSFASRTPSPRKPWITQSTLDLITQARRAHQLNSPESSHLWKQAKKAARADKKHWIQHLMETDNSPYKRNLWLTVKTQKKGFSARRTRLIRNGIVAPWSQTHIAFRDHYATERWAPPEIPLELLDSIQQGSVRMGPASPILPISAEELTEAIRKLKKGKAPGHDALTSDMVRALDAFGEAKILALLNSCLKLRKIPVAWKRAVVISFYKGKGKETQIPLPTDPSPFSPSYTSCTLPSCRSGSRSNWTLLSAPRNTAFALHAGPGMPFSCFVACKIGHVL